MRKSIVTLLLLVFLTSVSLTSTAQNNGTSGLDKKLQKSGKKAGDDYWEYVSSLSTRDNADRDTFRNYLDDSSPKVRIAAAYCLYNIGRSLSGNKNPDLKKNLKREALTALIDTAKKGSSSVRSLACEGIWVLTEDDANYGDINPLMKKLKLILEDTGDDATKINVSRALFAISGFSLKAIDTVKQIASTVNPETRYQAAIALAEMDEYDTAKPILKEYSSLPTKKGRYANTLLKRINLAEDVERMKDVENGSGEQYPLINEVLQKINQFYVDIDKVTRKELIQGAAEGIMGKLDRFSTYLDRKEFENLTQDINMEYAGIGAIVTMRDGWLTIEQPIYSGPAYDAGLRSKDQIVEVEGESTFEKTLAELVDRLKGKPGTDVNIKVMRRGWTEPHPFTITRQKIDMVTAKHRMLPGNIGYIQLISFGQDTAKEMKKAVASLKEQGMKSLIVDVRNNSGGYLTAAVGICDLFMKKGQTVVSIKGRIGEKKRIANSDQFYKGPMSVLVNGGSASASEIFSGAMQDKSRATVIGSRTYGKGSVQKLFRLDATNKQSALKLTWAKYYLPSGRTIHKPKEDTPKSEEWGVRPDINVSPEEADFWFAYASQEILTSDAPKKYFDQHKDEHLETFKKLAEYDNYDWKKYPDFNEFYNSLGTKLDKNNVRKLIRNYIRRRLGDIRGKAYIYNYQDDLQLQRSIYQSLKSRGVDPAKYEPYRKFVEKFQAEENKNK